MNQITVYIPSYFGQGPLRNERVNIHQRQLDWLLQSPLVGRIYICSQDYHFGEKRKSHMIEYIDHPRISPAAARNVLLEHFYQSSKTRCVFMDNDIVPNRDFTFFYQFANEVLVKSKYVKYDILMFTPAKDGAKEKKSCRVSRTSTFITQFFFMNNEREQYFDESYKDMEDYEYGLRLIANGGQIYTTEDCNFYSHQYENSVIYQSWKERTDKYSKIRIALEEKYEAILGEKFLTWFAKQSFQNITIQLNL